MRLRLSLFWLCALWLTSQGPAATGQSNLAQTNLSYLYDPEAAVRFESRVAVGDAEATVFLEITTRQPGQSPAVRYQIKSSYQADNIIAEGSIDDQQLVKQEKNAYYYRLEIPVADEANYLFIFAQTTAENNPTEFRYDIPLTTENSFPATDLLVMRPDEDLPLFTNALAPGQPFRIVSLYRQPAQVYMYYYSYEFRPNPPPMAVRSADAPQSMTIDSLLAIDINDTLRLEQQGLYFVQTDTTSLSGISFRISNEHFPRLVMVDHVIEPLRYVSTSEEMEALENSEDPKEALDRYLMKVTRSQNRAKSFMRNYYRNVTEANRLFTSYKEGWKTGQGMVYVLYGPPDQVFRDNDREVWVYNADQDLADLNFSFAKVKNIYTNQHYNLIPDEDYKKFWFRNIDLWRKGMRSSQ